MQRADSKPAGGIGSGGLSDAAALSSSSFAMPPSAAPLALPPLSLDALCPSCGVRLGLCVSEWASVLVCAGCDAPAREIVNPRGEAAVLSRVPVMLERWDVAQRMEMMPVTLECDRHAVNAGSGGGSGSSSGSTGGGGGGATTASATGNAAAASSSAASASSTSAPISSSPASAAPALTSLASHIFSPLDLVGDPLSSLHFVTSFDPYLASSWLVELAEAESIPGDVAAMILALDAPSIEGVAGGNTGDAATKQQAQKTEAAGVTKPKAAAATATQPIKKQKTEDAAPIAPVSVDAEADAAASVAAPSDDAEEELLRSEERRVARSILQRNVSEFFKKGSFAPAPAAAAAVPSASVISISTAVGGGLGSKSQSQAASASAPFSTVKEETLSDMEVASDVSRAASAAAAAAAAASATASSAADKNGLTSRATSGLSDLPALVRLPKPAVAPVATADTAMNDAAAAVGSGLAPEDEPSQQPEPTTPLMSDADLSSSLAGILGVGSLEELEPMVHPAAAVAVQRSQSQLLQANSSQTEEQAMAAAAATVTAGGGLLTRASSLVGLPAPLRSSSLLPQQQQPPPGLTTAVSSWLHGDQLTVDSEAPMGTNVRSFSLLSQTLAADFSGVGLGVGMQRQGSTAGGIGIGAGRYSPTHHPPLGLGGPRGSSFSFLGQNGRGGGGGGSGGVESLLFNRTSSDLFGSSPPADGAAAGAGFAPTRLDSSFVPPQTSPPAPVSGSLLASPRLSPAAASSMAPPPLPGSGGSHSSQQLSARLPSVLGTGVAGYALAQHAFNRQQTPPNLPTHSNVGASLSTFGRTGSFARLERSVVAPLLHSQYLATAAFGVAFNQSAAAAAAESSQHAQQQQQWELQHQPQPSHWSSAPRQDDLSADGTVGYPSSSSVAGGGGSAAVDPDMVGDYILRSPVAHPAAPPQRYGSVFGSFSGGDMMRGSPADYASYGAGGATAAASGSQQVNTYGGSVSQDVASMDFDAPEVGISLFERSNSGSQQLQMQRDFFAPAQGQGLGGRSGSFGFGAHNRSTTPPVAAAAAAAGHYTRGGAPRARPLDENSLKRLAGAAPVRGGGAAVAGTGTKAAASSTPLRKIMDLLGVSSVLRNPLVEYCHKLGTDEATARLAAHITREMQILKLSATRESNSICAAALYLAMVLQGKKPVQGVFCKQLGRTEVTLRKIYKGDMLNRWWDLVPFDYEPVFTPADFCPRPPQPKISPTAGRLRRLAPGEVSAIPQRSASSTIHALHGEWRKRAAVAAANAAAAAAAAATTAAATNSAKHKTQQQHFASQPIEGYDDEPMDGTAQPAAASTTPTAGAASPAAVPAAAPIVHSLSRAPSYLQPQRSISTALSAAQPNAAGLGYSAPFLLASSDPTGSLGVPPAHLGRVLPPGFQVVYGTLVRATGGVGGVGAASAAEAVPVGALRFHVPQAYARDGVRAIHTKTKGAKQATTAAATAAAPIPPRVRRTANLPGAVREANSDSSTDEDEEHAAASAAAAAAAPSASSVAPQLKRAKSALHAAPDVPLQFGRPPRAHVLTAQERLAAAFAQRQQAWGPSLRA